MSTLHLPQAKAKPLGISPNASAANASPETATAAQAMQLSSHELLQGRRSVEITHNGATYRLSATRMGKLILTK